MLLAAQGSLGLHPSNHILFVPQLPFMDLRAAGTAHGIYRLQPWVASMVKAAEQYLMRWDPWS